MTRTLRAVGLLAASALVAPALPAVPAVTQIADRLPDAPNFYRFHVGSFLVTVLSDGTSTLPFDSLLRGMSPNKVRSAFAELGEAPDRGTSINAFLIDDGKKRILIDAGAGTDLGACCGGLPEALRQAGYRASTIDAVLLTHLHSDHAGGLAANGQRVFPSAKIYLARAEYDFWMSDLEAATTKPELRPLFARARAAVAPYRAADQLRFVDGSKELFPGVTAIASTGHTPGHTFYRIANGGESVVVVGDLVHAAEVQLPHPSVTIAFDNDQVLARAVRKRTLADLARTHELVAAAHINFPGVGHVARSGDGYAWAPLPHTVH